MSATNMLTEVPVSATYTGTNQAQLQAANTGQQTAVNNITNSLSGSATMKALQALYGTSTADTPFGSYNANYNPFIQKNDAQIAATQPYISNNDFSNYNPYMQAGANATNQMQNMLGIGTNPQSATDAMNAYLATPQMQNQMNVGMQAVNSGMSKGGLINSGAQAKALNQYGQGFASSNIGNYYSQLSNLASQGASAANNYASSLLSQSGQNATATSNAYNTQANLMGQQQQYYGTQAQTNQNAANLVNSNSQLAANLQAQAASQQASALTGGADKSTVNTGWTNGIMNGMVSSANTSMNLS